ncbi:hypothetical protein D9M68_978640 [compost metagenome]
MHEVVVEGEDHGVEIAGRKAGQRRFGLGIALHRGCKRGIGGELFFHLGGSQLHIDFVVAGDGEHGEYPLFAAGNPAFDPCRPVCPDFDIFGQRFLRRSFAAPLPGLSLGAAQGDTA